jgi:hypothetical protein
LNTFIVLFFSIFLTALVVYIYVRDQLDQEPVTVAAPLQIEAYRVDRNPLPEADIYLNQRFIGRTDNRGFFLKDINLTVGESYLLRIEKERDGYIYGPWETGFKVAEERKLRRRREREIDEQFPTLEGEFDVMAELQRAELGRVSLYEKYHFLAIIDGYMYYTIQVKGWRNSEIPDAQVIVNGKEEGLTDQQGVFVVRYSGDDTRSDMVQVFKEGEHIWQKSVEIYPNATVDVGLNTMLLMDLHAYTENYDIIQGVADAKIFINDEYVGETGGNGLFSYSYENEEGVDGRLSLRIQYPAGYYPENQEKNFVITSDYPRLTYSGFSNRVNAMSPRITVLPFQTGERGDVLLSKRANDLKRSIEDYLRLGGIFNVVSDRRIAPLLRHYGVKFDEKNKTQWSTIPFVKNEVDGIIFGRLEESGNALSVHIYGVDYTGETIWKSERRVALRELKSLTESFVNEFRNNFPFEGTILAVDKGIVINLGSLHGVGKDDRFNGFLNYYDTIRKDYSRRRVAKLRITDVSGNSASGELESIDEGYLLEPGVKVKRFSEPSRILKQITVTISVSSGREQLPGANIYLDDQWTGQTDEAGVLNIGMTENSFADVLVYKEGYIPVETSMKATAEETGLNINLKRGKTIFTIDSKPRGALLFINGEFMGNTPVLKGGIELPYGFHRIELKLEGYKEYNRYVKISDRRVSLTDDEAIILYQDFYREAENAYEEGQIDRALDTLMSIPESHPDYAKSMEFCGYIHLYNYEDYEAAITCYSRVLDLTNADYGSVKSISSYYNFGQACYNRAEELFYTDSYQARTLFRTAAEAFDIVKKRRSRLQSPNRHRIYQDVLYYIAVSYQKLYYLTGTEEYVSKAYYSWIDYFDFFDNNFLRDPYFQKQYKIAESYKEEVKRLRSED